MRREAVALTRPRDRRRVAAVVALIACIVTAGGAGLAQWSKVHRLSGAASVAPSAQVSSFSPSSPAKEYIYAGGRLVATEEPAPPAGPSNLRYVQTSASGFTTTGYINWNDNTDNETGFVIENFADGVWGQFGQVGPNTSRYDLSVTGPGYDFRVKASFAGGAPTYSNVIHVMGPGCYCPSAPGSSAPCSEPEICYSISPCTPPTSLVISEFRARGAAGSKDEFVEFYNNSDSPVTVCTADTSGGWTLAARSADGTSAAPVFTIPYDTVIPARGHYLVTNTSPGGAYSLTSHPADGGTTATGDLTYTADMADNAGLALFKTANPSNFTSANRLDAVGFSGPTGTIPDLYREGAGLAPVGTGDGQYSFARRIGADFLPRDMNDNVADWVFLSTDGGAYGGMQSTLGMPGPENLSSPVLRLGVHVNLLDQNVVQSQPPNRVRRTCADPAVEECDPTRSALGTLSIRRKVINNTGAAVTRLRFRVYDITTKPSPAGTADLRAITSGDITVTLSGGATVAVRGTALESPPAQALGGGLHTTMTVTLQTPLAAGEVVNVQFLFGVQQGGSFRVAVFTEALP